MLKNQTMIRYTREIGVLFCLLLLGCSVKRQGLSSKVWPVYEMSEVDILPVYPGGDKEFLKFIVENLKHPALSEGQPTPGNARFSFVVEMDGSLTETKSDPDLFDQQIKEVTKKMPRWKAGIKGGKSVRVRMTIPISCIKWE